MLRISPRFAFALSLVLLGTPLFAQQDRSPAGPPTAERMLTMDRDGDGVLTKEETTGLLKRFFDRNDANKDGKLDRNELLALEKRLAAGRQAGNRQQNRNNGSPARKRPPTDDQLRRSAPDDVIIEPNLAYRPGPSKAWRLDLIRPKVDADEKRPGIVFVHGGGWKNGDKRSGYFLSGAIEYAQQGYVCVTLNYRLTGEAPFPASIEDVKCAVRWLRENAERYGVDPSRIGGYGNSAGAHLVSMLGLCKPAADLEGDGPYQDRSSLLQAVCASATPAELSWFPNMSRAGGPFPGEAAERLALIKKCSPLHHVDKTAPPFLLVHGTADRTVNIKHGDALAKALKDAGTDVTYLRIEDAGHGVFGQHSTQTHPAMKAFFDRTLNPRTSKPPAGDQP